MWTAIRAQGVTWSCPTLTPTGETQDALRVPQRGPVTTTSRATRQRDTQDHPPPHNPKREEPVRLCLALK